MFLGKVCELGSTKQIYENPKHPYSRFLLEAVPKPDPKLRKEKNVLQGEMPSPVHPPKGCRFHTRCPHCIEVCTKEEPLLKDIDGRQIACHIDLGA
jgi:oligopeptide/dipeptide ABC transporter ATP-binding protein